MTGHIIGLHPTFGFIRGDDPEGGTYFFHGNDLVAASSAAGGFNDLAKGDGVSFDEEIPAPVKGRRARNVRVETTTGSPAVSTGR